MKFPDLQIKKKESDTYSDILFAEWFTGAENCAQWSWGREHRKDLALPRDLHAGWKGRPRLIGAYSEVNWIVCISSGFFLHSQVKIGDRTLMDEL